MVVLESCPKHNMVAYLEKTDGNAEFHEIIDFLARSSIHNALTEDSGGNHKDQAKEIKHLKAQIKKLKQKAKPVITHHRAWMKSVSMKQRLAGKKSLKTQWMQKESVSKKGRKSAKAEPSVHKDPAFDELDDDEIDHIETEDVQDAGRIRYVLVTGQTRNVGTDRQEVSTDKDKVSTDRANEGTVDQTEGRSATPTPTPTIFGDDETIAQVLLNMSQAKTVSREIGGKGDLALRLQKEERGAVNYGRKKPKFLHDTLRQEGFWQNKEMLPSETDPPSFKISAQESDDALLNMLETRNIRPENKLLKKYKLFMRKVKRLNNVSSQRMGGRLSCDYQRPMGNFRHSTMSLQGTYIYLIGQDLFHLYDLVMKRYSEVTLEGFELILWGDLKIMMESSTEENDQKLKDGTVIHMLVERRYPLSKDLLQRMLALGLEVERESTAALDLIRFIKQQIDEKVFNSPCFMVKSWLVQDQTVSGKDYSNLLIADSLLKTIWFINAPCYGNEALTSPKANGVWLKRSVQFGTHTTPLKIAAKIGKRHDVDGYHSLFSMRIHHGGYFTDLPRRKYVNGKENIVDASGIEEFSVYEVDSIMKQLGYNETVEPIYYHFLIPRKDLDVGLEALGFWKMQIEDYLYQKKLHEPLAEAKPTGMKAEDWALLDRQALGAVRLSLAKNVATTLSIRRLYPTCLRLCLICSIVTRLRFTPGSWSDTVTAVSSSTKSTKLKFDNICDLLIGEDIRRKTSGEYSNSLLSAEDKGKGRKQDRGQKQNKGHFQNQCSKPVTSKDKKVNMAAGDYDDALVCCVENMIDDRIMDSGASFYATYCKEELERFKLRSGLKKRLISVGQLDEEGYHVGFEDQQWKVTKGSLVVAHGNKRGSLYMVEVPSDGINAAINSRGNTALWHQRLGHMSEKGMKILASNARKVWVYFLKNKSEVFNTFKKWKATVENETNLRVKCLKSDNGGEYSSQDFIEYCVENGIRMLKTIPETPQQNGVAAKMNRTLNESANVPTFLLVFRIPEVERKGKDSY
ncbi:retrovirus-related pol polyprotein from transposon TNT 1-94 [Tanacetum coccineum]|uniref:Retrovirus-related pol polyprotein from transposon TNT 1-94 n=1 Tax=Tanacetum coccineum TaxID=301880 RepID=A0ABQ5A9L5_9ASTR